VGGHLAARGLDVTLVGRARLGDELEAHGLHLEDLDGRAVHVSRASYRFATEPSALAQVDVVLCAVKSGQTEETARALDGVVPREAIVVSLQNGVRNAGVLRAHLGGRRVLGGIVGFNVVTKGAGVFRRTTSGPLVIEHASSPAVTTLLERSTEAGFEVEAPHDIAPMQWSKLVTNLSNAVSALSDRPTPELLTTPGYRRILRAIMAEALFVLRKTRTRTARVGPLPVAFFPWILRLPTPLVRVVAKAQVKIDAEARSSMWDDLTRGRATEVDWLNGEIVRLADSVGRRAPLNRRIVELVHEAERLAKGSPGFSPEIFAKRLGL
jgi:2-dehydropantoate 2-reductase